MEIPSDTSPLQRPALDHVVLREPQLAVDESKFVDHAPDRLDRLCGDRHWAVKQGHMGRKLSGWPQPVSLHGGAEVLVALKQRSSVAAQDQRTTWRPAVARWGNLEGFDDTECLLGRASLRDSECTDV